MSLEFEKAKAQFISTFSREIGRFDFRNSAGEAALRAVVAITYGACPIQFSKTGKLQASMSIRAIAEESGMSRSRTERAVAGLERFDVLSTGKVASSSKTLYVLRPPNVWKSWIDLMKSGRAGAATMQQKSGRADEATFENQGGRADVASLEGKVAAPPRPFPFNKMTDSSSYAFNAEPSDAEAGSVIDAACVSPSYGTAFIGGEAPPNGASPAYEIDAIQAAKDVAQHWLASQYDFDVGHVDDLIDGFGPNACAAARDDAAAALTEALSGLPLNIAAQKVEVYSRTALELLRAVHGGPDLRREVYDMGRVVMNKIEKMGARHVG